MKPVFLRLTEMAGWDGEIGWIDSRPTFKAWKWHGDDLIHRWTWTQYPRQRWGRSGNGSRWVRAPVTRSGRYGTGDPYCPGANLCRSIRD